MVIFHSFVYVYQRVDDLAMKFDFRLKGSPESGSTSWVDSTGGFDEGIFGGKSSW
jgi:hypothetical protein